MSVPVEWIEELFRRLSVRYGDQWFRKWDNLNPEDVKADWARELRGFYGKPWAIAYALEHLPGDWPPTATVFRELCGMASDPAPVKRLPAPPRLPERARTFREKVVGLFAPKADNLAWARQLREQERAGRSLTMMQRMAWREGLGDDSMAPPPDPGVLADAKAAERRRVELYAAEHGLSLELQPRKWHDGTVPGVKR